LTSAVAAPDGRGYHIIDDAGQVFAYGDATWLGGTWLRDNHLRGLRLKDQHGSGRRSPKQSDDRILVKRRVV